MTDCLADVEGLAGLLHRGNGCRLGLHDVPHADDRLHAGSLTKTFITMMLQLMGEERL
ncbi:hypothetical protein [Streptomyces zagrosensis]|uniref:Uncharacterized protein n=1 Tax=Streptomyces zagrosensis TaxID=1042984 RepID=A0A7W9QHS1_9ACTN|nr:hypothetical protein [Streptomyces zagrosensis]MBB5939202.1 hypothetical protein [Streptomyces zagrosensis]